MKIAGIPMSVGYSSSSAALEVIGVIVLLIGAIATIALTIMCWIFYLKKKDNKHRNTFLGRFFNFDYYVLQTILKAFFIFCVVTNVVATIAIPVAFGIMAAGYDALAGFGTFIIFLIICAIWDGLSILFWRLVFEGSMIFVNLGDDTRAIRRKICPEGSDEYSSTSFANELNSLKKPEAAKKQKADPKAPSYQQQPKENPVAPQAAQPASDEWVCSKCGRTMEGGNFCVGCGSKRA